MYSYGFIYPIYGFSVPSGENPEDYTDGSSPWEFKTSIAIIKQSYEFHEMPEWMINGAKIISYLYNENGSIVENLKVILLNESQNMDEISVDFTEFYRWIELEKGYIFEYYAVFPVPENQQISLKSNLYIYNFKNNCYDQSKQIQFK